MASGAGLLVLLVLGLFLHTLAFMPVGQRRAWESRARACVRRYATPDPSEDAKSIESLLGKGKGDHTSFNHAVCGLVAACVRCYVRVTHRHRSVNNGPWHLFRHA